MEFNIFGFVVTIGRKAKRNVLRSIAPVAPKRNVLKSVKTVHRNVLKKIEKIEN